MLEFSENLFLVSIVLVMMFAIAIAVALRFICNYVQRNAQNEIYRSFYERNIQDYYRKISSFFRRRQEPQNTGRAISRRVLNTEEFQKMNQRGNDGTRFPFEIPEEERPPLMTVDPTTFKRTNSLHTPLDQIRLYKSADFQNAPQKDSTNATQRNLPFLRDSTNIIPSARPSTESFKLMGVIPEESERCSMESLMKEEEQENKVPSALKQMRHTELVTEKEQAMYREKRKFD